MIHVHPEAATLPTRETPLEKRARVLGEVRSQRMALAAQEAAFLATKALVDRLEARALEEQAHDLSYCVVEGNKEALKAAYYLPDGTATFPSAANIVLISGFQVKFAFRYTKGEEGKGRFCIKPRLLFPPGEENYTFFLTRLLYEKLPLGGAVTLARHLVEKVRAKPEAFLARLRGSQICEVDSGTCEDTGVWKVSSKAGHSVTFAFPLSSSRVDAHLRFYPPRVPFDKVLQPFRHYRLL